VTGASLPLPVRTAGRPTDARRSAPRGDQSDLPSDRASAILTNLGIPGLGCGRHFVVPFPQTSNNPNTRNTRKYLRLASLPRTMPAAGACGTCCRGQFARRNHEMPLSTYWMSEIRKTRKIRN